MSTITQHDDVKPRGAMLLDEAQQLLAPLRALKSRLVTRLLLGELARIFVAVLLCGLAVMILDAVFRWRTPAPRWVGSCVLLVMLLATLVHAIVRRSWSFTLMGLTERIEEIIPSLRGDLRSAVSIAQAPIDDPLAGSPRLRQRVLQKAATALAKVDLSSALSSRSMRLRGIVGLCGLLGLMIWMIAAPTMVSQAARRLVAPWRLDAWPRLVVLELEAPSKIARGGDVLVVARSKTNHLPAKATIYLADERGHVDSQIMHREEQRFVYSISKVKEPVWMRVVGGDDDQMQWRRLEVVEPVSLSATRLEAIPPSYTSAPPIRVGNEMTLLEGTKLVMEFRASRSIKEARPLLAGQSPSSYAALKVDSTGRMARGEMTLTASTGGGSSRLRVDVRDREGALVSGAWNGSVKVLRDLPPSIEWRAPKSPVKVQPQSRILLEATASDDVRLAAMELRRRIVKAENRGVNDDASWQMEVATPIKENLKEGLFTRDIDLSGLELKSGDAVEWMLIAVNAKGQAKESEVLRCAVVELEELRKATDKKLERFLEQLVDAARRQRETALSLEQANPPDNPRAARLATVRAAQFDEHALVELFSKKANGLLQSWQSISAEQEAHQLLSPADREQLEGVTVDLTSIAQEDLPGVLRELEQIQNEAVAATSEVTLTSAVELTKKTSDHLEEVVDRLAHWRRWSRASQTVDELLDAQQKLQKQTRDATPQLLGKDLEELDDEETRLLKSLAEKQAALARQLADLPLPPDSRGESWRSARGVADDEMRQAARDLTKNNLSEADSHQEKALSAMRELSQEGELGGGETKAGERSDGQSNAAAEKPRTGPTEAQVREVLALQSELREKTKFAIEALAKPRADRVAIEAELTRLAAAQAELAKKVEAWQARSEANQEEKPRE